MNGPEHYANAQLMIASAVTHFASGDRAEGEFVIKVAQVHATLALTAATALYDADLAGGDDREYQTWRRVAGTEATP